MKISLTLIPDIPSRIPVEAPAVLFLIFLGFPHTLEKDGLDIGKRLFSPSKSPDCLWGPHTLKYKRVLYLQSLKRPGREVNHSQIYTLPKLMMSDLYISAHFLYLHGMDSTTFALIRDTLKSCALTAKFTAVTFFAVCLILPSQPLLLLTPHLPQHCMVREKDFKIYSLVRVSVVS